MMNMSLVNNSLDKLAHYVSRITSTKMKSGAGLSKIKYYVN